MRECDIYVLTRFVCQLKFHLPLLIPKTFHGFKRDNAHGKKSELDDEAKAILREWGSVDDKLYKAAKVIYAKKQAIAERCLRLFGELLENEELEH